MKITKLHSLLLSTWPSALDRAGTQLLLEANWRLVFTQTPIWPVIWRAEEREEKMGGEGMLQKRIRKEDRRELSHKEETTSWLGNKRSSKRSIREEEENVMIIVAIQMELNENWEESAEFYFDLIDRILLLLSNVMTHETHARRRDFWQKIDFRDQSAEDGTLPRQKK